MSLGLRLNGKAIGIEPGDPTFAVYANRDAIGSWEEIDLQHHEGGWYDVRFIAANRQLTITPDGKLESRPAGTYGPWECFPITNRDGQRYLERAGVVLLLDGDAAPMPAPSSLHLEQRGEDFVDATGARIVLPGCDGFLAFRQYLDGGPDVLAPFFEQSSRLGFVVWRIWSQGSKRQNTVMELSPRESGYYDDVRPFADLLNQHGIIPLMTVYVDNQDVQSPIGHWVELGDRLKGSATLMSGFNQWTKNKSTFDPWALPPLNGLIWSRGSDVEDTITDPHGAPASELHATRNSFDRALMDSTASPSFMRSKGAGMIWMTEGNPFGDGRGYSAEQAWKLGRAYSIDWALAVLHDRQSQAGRLMHDDTARCAAAWVRGMSL